MGPHRTTRTPRAAWVAVSLVGVLALGACGGDDEASPPPPPTTDASPATDGSPEDGTDTTTRSEPSGGEGGEDTPSSSAPGEPTAPGDDPEGAEDADDPDDSGDDPTATLPGAPSVSAPAYPLTPSDPAWAAACAAATTLSTQAWSLVSGGTTDAAAVGANVLALLDALPPGVAEDDAAALREVVTAFAANDDLAPFEDAFGDHVDGLVAAVDQGCGVGGGQELVPDAARDQLEALLFG